MSLFDRLRRRRALPDGPLDCREVGRVLQQVLDGEIDATVADRVAEHLDLCLVCGLEADTYLRIKDALLSERTIERGAAERLRAFGQALAAGQVDPGTFDPGPFDPGTFDIDPPGPSG